jgi:hypothetical protein
MTSKPYRRRLCVSLLLAACWLPLLDAHAAPSRAEKGRTRADWTRNCERRAEETAMRQKLRPPFIRQCTAGYRINSGTDLQAKKEKF